MEKNDRLIMEKKIIVLEGIIDWMDWGNWSSTCLKQPDGLKQDLISRFQEVENSFPDKTLTIRYWITYKPLSKQELSEEMLKQLSGHIDASREADHYSYSEYTSGTDYNSNLTVGGHNIQRELDDNLGKFARIEIEIN